MVIRQRVNGRALERNTAELLVPTVNRCKRRIMYKTKPGLSPRVVAYYWEVTLIMDFRYES